MAVKWSWAFGQENATLLNDDMEWQLFAALGSYVPDNSFTYTYAGSPGRYSLKVNSGADFYLPVQSFTPSGWLTAAIYNDSPGWVQNTYFLQVIGGNSRYISIYMSNAAANTFALYVDNTLKATFSLPIGNWHYWALQYDMSADPWSGRVFVDGVAVTATFTDSQTAQTTGVYHSEGFSSNSSFPTAGTTYFAQFIVYDSLGDAGEVPKFVTRLSPDLDSSEVGTWTPSAGATNVGVTANDPFDPTTYTEDTTPISGENVVTTFAADIATQLGISPTSIDGVTTHAYASGTAINSFASCGDSGSFTDGSTFTPDLADTTYGYATAPINPNTAVAWTGTDTVQTKFEIV
jgi:hypothetical protein